MEYRAHMRLSRLSFERRVDVLARVFVLARRLAVTAPGSPRAAAAGNNAANFSIALLSGRGVCAAMEPKARALAAARGCPFPPKWGSR